MDLRTFNLIGGIIIAIVVVSLALAIYEDCEDGLEPKLHHAK